jgi:S-adenosylhomocysteine hydrolase
MRRHIPIPAYDGSGWGDNWPPAPELMADIIGATEETTTGVIREQAMEAAGASSRRAAPSGVR